MYTYMFMFVVTELLRVYKHKARSRFWLLVSGLSTWLVSTHSFTVIHVHVIVHSPMCTHIHMHILPTLLQDWNTVVH